MKLRESLQGTRWIMLRDLSRRKERINRGGVAQPSVEFPD